MNFRTGLSGVLFAFIAGIALLIASCKSQDTSVIDDNSYNASVPHIDAYVVSPDTTDTNILPPSSKLPGDSVTVNLTVFLTLAPDTPPVSIASASAAVIGVAGDTLARVALHNDGVPPDAVANDSIYSAAVNFRILRKQVGIYRVAASITNMGNSGNGGEIGVHIINSGNLPPQITNLIAPDSITVPADSTIKNYVMSVRASDPEGLDDILSVSADIYNAKNQYLNTLALKDDGKDTVDGDSVAGDGIFSVFLPVDSSYAENAPYTYYFYATDKSGAASDTLKKTIYTR